MWCATISLVISYLAISKAQSEFRIATTNQGPVRGYKAVDSEVFEFYGIPYATAPTGFDKFKAPLLPPTWTETFDAVDRNIACPQKNVSIDLHIQEDCLVANVFTPSIETTNLPVVVFIHGGNYYSGKANNYSPMPLVESQKLVAVNINYRLGAHGFLCLGTEDVPGNAGLRDMIAGLRWVKENIANFGGNPDDVTLAGYSTGAASADLLSLSKAAEGLFNKLMLDSGAHVASWSVKYDPIGSAIEHAQNLGFDNTGTLEDLENFYKTISYELLLSDTDPKYDSAIAFAPCIENDLGQEIILDDSPLNIVKSGRHRHLPSLYGFGNMEGIMRISAFDSWAPRMNEKFSDFLVVDINVENDDQKEEVAQMAKDFYFGNSPVGLYTFFSYINYFSDVMFAYPILKSVRLQNEAGNENIYLYEFTFYNKFISVPGVLDVLTNFPGATHCALTHALLEDTRISNADIYTEEYKHLRTQIRELWVNFITTGTPVPEGSSFPPWPPANASRSPYMILGNTIELGGVLNEERAQFWDSIYDKYGYSYQIPPEFVEPERGQNNAHMISGSIIRNIICIYLGYALYKFV